MLSVQSYTKIHLQEQTWYLLPQKAVYWEEANALIFSDLHIGKAGHFRKSGIPISGELTRHDLAKLKTLSYRFRPDRILILGDLFHSTYNKEWESLATCIKEISDSLHTQISLILGNHDILRLERYQQLGMEVYTNFLSIDPFCFIHEPVLERSQIPDGLYAVSGHIHPGVQLRGSGRQKLHLPCFHFNDHQAILPAFGKFTGLYIVLPKKKDRIYAIADNQVITLNK